MPDPNTPDNGGTPGDGDANPSSTPLTYESWLETLEDDKQQLLTEHTAGLKTALDDERTQRKTLASDLRDAVKAMKKSAGDETALAELTTSLGTLTEQLDETERKAQFYEAMAGKVSNVRLAFIAAQSAGLVDAKRGVDAESLQTQFPELFPGKQSGARGNAGDGAGSPPPVATSMTALIRKGAGVQP